MFHNCERQSHKTVSTNSDKFTEPFICGIQMKTCVLCRWIQTYERFKRTLFIRIKDNMRLFGVIPFIKLQTDT